MSISIYEITGTEGFSEVFTGNIAGDVFKKSGFISQLTGLVNGRLPIGVEWCPTLDSAIGVDAFETALFTFVGVPDIVTVFHVRI